MNKFVLNFEKLKIIFYFKNNNSIIIVNVNKD